MKPTSESRLHTSRRLPERDCSLHLTSRHQTILGQPSCATSRLGGRGHVARKSIM